MNPVGHDQTTGRTVLVVHHEPAEREALARLVGQWGYAVQTAASVPEALARAEALCPPVVLAGPVSDAADGLGLVQQLRQTARPPAVLFVSGPGAVDRAVEAVHRGALDYLTEPVDATRLRVLLEKAIEHEALSREVRVLRHQLRQKGGFGPLVGQAKAMHEIYRSIETAAAGSAPVLVSGDPGTGKELVARTIHDFSSRRGGPFVAVVCVGIPASLVESELFGHEGADDPRPKAGCFELADGGTLFLDEIAALDDTVQARLLRALHDRRVRRVGAAATEVPVDVRLVAATSRTPAEAMPRGPLREELLDRLDAVVIRLPALRERLEDVTLLARTFIEEVAPQQDGQSRGLTAEAEQALQRHAWPGNVRELRNVIERAVVLSGSGPIGLGHLPDDIRHGVQPAPSIVPGRIRTIRELEREAILKALEETGQDKRTTAAMLGISLKTLYNKLARYGVAARSARMP